MTARLGCEYGRGIVSDDQDLRRETIPSLPANMLNVVWKPQDFVGARKILSDFENEREVEPLPNTSFGTQ